MKPIHNLAIIGMLIAACTFIPIAVQAAPKLDDETIFAIFDQANSADITTGRLGWTKSDSPEVRKLAKMVVHDHIAVQAMGRALANKMGLVGTLPLGDHWMADQAAAFARLEQLDGKAFDLAYLSHEIDFHAAVIKVVRETLLPSIHNAEFRQLVTDVLPGFEHHLAETRALASKLGVR